MEGPFRLPLTRFRAFANGVHVLLVDYDTTCLKSVAKMLESCSYKVTTVELASVALSMFRENEGKYPIVMADVHNPDMDGFTFLNHISDDENTAVFLMSADEEASIAKRALENGACHFLQKPITTNTLKNIWQHVYRKLRHKIREMEDADPVDGTAPEEIPQQDVERAPITTDKKGKQHVSKNKEQQKDKGKSTEEDTSSRLTWSEDLHRKFLQILDVLGGPTSIECLPRRIHEMMGEPSITRLHIASHLQKYRNHVRRVLNLTASLPPSMLYRQPELISHPVMSFDGTPSNNCTSTQMIHLQHQKRPVGPGLFGRNLGEGSSSVQRMPHDGLIGRLNEVPHISYTNNSTGEGTSVNGGFPSNNYLRDNMWNESAQESSALGPLLAPQMGLIERPHDLSKIDYTNNYTGVQVTSSEEVHGLNQIRITNGTLNCINLSENMSNESEKENFALGSETDTLQIQELGTTSPHSSQNPRTFTDLLEGQYDQDLGSFSDMLESSMFENNSIPQKFTDFNHHEVFLEQDDPNTEDLDSFSDPLESPMIENNSLSQQFNEFENEEVFPEQGRDDPNIEDLGSFSDLLESSIFGNNSLPQQLNEFDHEEVFPEKGQDDPNTEDLGSFLDPLVSSNFGNNSLPQQLNDFDHGEIFPEQGDPNTKDLGSFSDLLKMFENDSLPQQFNEFDHEEVFPKQGDPNTKDLGSFSDLLKMFENDSLSQQFNEFDHEEVFPKQDDTNTKEIDTFLDPLESSILKNNSLPKQFINNDHEEIFPEQDDPNKEVLGSLSYLLESSMFENDSFLQQFNDSNCEEVLPEQTPDGTALLDPGFDISARG